VLLLLLRLLLPVELRLLVLRLLLLLLLRVLVLRLPAKSSATDRGCGGWLPTVAVRRVWLL
jgi:hypothetical protein